MSLQNAVLVNASEVLSVTHLAARELFKGYPDGLLKLAMVFCVIAMLIGIPGNIITIVALARYKKVRNATAMFIMSLSFSDLLFCFNIPFAASVFHNRAWIHGQTLCLISLFIRYTLFINSLITVLTITINRYILIAHPTIYTKIYKKRNVIIMLVCLWIFSFVSVIPIVFVKQGPCSIQKDHKQSLKKVIFSTAFILTCTAIILCYSRIFCIVKKVNNKSINKDKRVKMPKEASSYDISTSVSLSDTDKISGIYLLKPIETTKILSTNPNSTDPFPKMIMSDKILRQAEKMGKQSPWLHQTIQKKSIKFMKMSHPTRRDKRLGTMIIAIIITFCLCHLPIMISQVFQYKNVNPQLRIASHVLFFLSFSVNPIIYVVMSSEYRKAYKNLFKCR